MVGQWWGLVVGMSLSKEICAVLGLDLFNWEGVLGRKPALKHAHTPVPF